MVSETQSSLTPVSTKAQIETSYSFDQFNRDASPVKLPVPYHPGSVDRRTSFVHLRALSNRVPGEMGDDYDEPPTLKPHSDVLLDARHSTQDEPSASNYIEKGPMPRGQTQGFEEPPSCPLHPYVCPIIILLSSTANDVPYLRS